MSTIEEAREQAREALELIHTWAQREQAWDTPRALDFARIGASIRALLDATDPSAIQYADSALVAEVAAKIAGENSELMERLADKPAEDEREALANVLLDGRDADEGLSALRDRILAAGYRKRPRPITDAMVEAAARVMFDAPGGMTGDYTWAEMVGEDPSRADIWRADARAALEAAEGARR